MSLPELLLITFIAALITDLATGLGVIPFFFVRDVDQKWSGMMTGMAAGMMTSASLVLLVGEALRKLNETGGGGALFGVWEVILGMAVGVIFFLFVSKWAGAHEGFDIAGLRETGGLSAVLVVIAMTIHSFPEGVAVGVSYGTALREGSHAFGDVITLAIALHNIPEGTAIAVALRAKGVGPWPCVGWAIFSSLPQPIAAVPSAWAVWLFEPLLPAGMGFAAGAMMYLVITDLIPDALENAGQTRAAISYFVGLGLMIALGELVAM